MADKKALCISRSMAARMFPIEGDISRLGSNSYAIRFSQMERIRRLTALDTELVSRYEGDRPCESDPERLQLITYITLAEENPETGQISRVLAYVRGKAGDEDRLHDMYSVGLGGHIDEAPDGVARQLMELVADEANRELEEELGGFNINHLLHLHHEGNPRVPMMGAIANTLYLLYDDTVDVQQVHLGLSIIVYMTPDEVASLEKKVQPEEGTIEKFKFIPVYHGMQDDYTFENWSNLVLNTLYR